MECAIVIRIRHSSVNEIGSGPRNTTKKCYLEDRYGKLHECNNSETCKN